MLGWISSPKAHNHLPKVCDNAVQCTGLHCKIGQPTLWDVCWAFDCTISGASGVALVRKTLQVASWKMTNGKWVYRQRIVWQQQAVCFVLQHETLKYILLVWRRTQLNTCGQHVLRHDIFLCLCCSFFCVSFSNSIFVFGLFAIWLALVNI